jgi:dsRNA-specific ribonuclease
MGIDMELRYKFKNKNLLKQALTHCRLTATGISTA